MIEFYRSQKCAFSDEVVEQLQALVVAHKVHWLEKGLQEDVTPKLVEGGKEYRTPNEINIFLSALNKELVLQREMQSDSCKIDPDNGTGCL